MGNLSQQEIQEFLKSGELGRETSFSSDILQRAAEKMFTSKGQKSPVAIIRRNRKTYLIRRDAI